MLICKNICERYKDSDSARYDLRKSFCSVCNAGYNEHLIHCPCCGCKTRHRSKHKLHYHRKYWGEEFIVPRIA